MAIEETRWIDEAGVAALVDELAARIEAGAKPGSPLVLIGIRRLGVPLAERIASVIGQQTNQSVPVGALDITLYRDDLGRGRRWPVLKGTDIPFPIDGAEVVLVDDVLFTGRTVRAAIDCVCDLGRPSSIRLAVLVDRGGRELPIQADYCGRTVTVDEGERVRVRLRPDDPADEVLRVRGESPLQEGGTT
jgi:pyrimidine operon attenuation protein / uracil phosphoribosyltransferase